MRELASKECVPCKEGVPSLKGPGLTELHDKLGHDWRVVDEHHLEKTYSCKNFRDALDITNHVGELAERVNHHPSIYLTWGKVKITIWTHAIDGLAEGDFILAAGTAFLTLPPCCPLDLSSYNWWASGACNCFLLLQGLCSQETTYNRPPYIGYSGAFLYTE